MFPFKIGISHKTFANKAQFLSIVFKRTNVQLATLPEELTRDQDQPTKTHTHTHTQKWQNICTKNISLQSGRLFCPTS